MKKAIFISFVFCNIAFSQQQIQAFNVYFESGSATVPHNSIAELNHFFVNDSIDAESLSVLAYCDDIGSLASNLTLSEQRAQAVISLLEKYGFDSISSKGNGEVGLINSTVSEESQRAKNRLAKIVVGYSVIRPETETATDDGNATDEGYKTFEDDLKVGDKVIVKQLLFDGSRTSFFNPEEAEAELSKIVEYFAKNPSVHFEIQGHVCCISASFKDARNIETGVNNLSQARAQKIYEFFLSKGISKDRMSHQGYGRQFPRKDVMESLNKRVEILITKI